MKLKHRLDLSTRKINKCCKNDAINQVEKSMENENLTVIENDSRTLEL